MGVATAAAETAVGGRAEVMAEAMAEVATAEETEERR
jgi:hypothetical protein